MGTRRTRRSIGLAAALVVLTVAPTLAAERPRVQTLLHVDGVDGRDGSQGIAISPDDKHVYVTGSFDDGVATHTRAADGTLTFVGKVLDTDPGVNGLEGARGVVVSPDGKHVYVASLADGAVTLFNRNPVSGVLTFAQTLLDSGAGGGALAGAHGVTISPDGKHVYVAARSDDAVTTFSRDATDGKLTFVEFDKHNVGGVTGLDAAEGVVVAPDGEFVYVASENSSSIAVFDRDVLTGKLAFVEVQVEGGGIDGLKNVNSVVVSPDGKHLYAAGEFDNNTLGDDDLGAVFTRDSATGKLTFVEAIPPFLDATGDFDCLGVSGGGGVAINGAGDRVYVSESWHSALLTFSRNATTGALTQVETHCEFLSGQRNVNQIAVSHDNANVYTTGLDGNVTIYAPGTDSVPLSPGRVYESRVGLDFRTLDGLFQGVGRTPAGTVAEVKVTGRAGVATNASAVFLNVVAVSPTGPGYLTVFPCGTTPPLAANVNYNGNDVAANAVLAKVGDGGKVCVFTLAATDLVIDVNGYVPSAGSPTPLPPARILESRNGPDDKTIDGQFQGTGRTPAGTVAEVKVTGRAGVATDASAVFLNVVAVTPSAGGYLTVFPCGTTPPLAANVNYNGNDVAANAVLAKVGDGGKVCIFTLAATDLVIDVNGYVPTAGSPTPLPPARILESRNGPDDKTIDGQFQGTGRTPAGTVAEVKVTGRAGVATDASAVFLNVVAVSPTGPGYLTVFPCGTTPPLAANVNYNGNDVAANAVLAKVGDGGKVCVFTLAATDFVIDVNGYIPN